MNLGGKGLTSLEGLLAIESIQDIKELILSGNQLHELFESEFEGLGKLESLSINKSNVYTIHIGAFKGLKNLKNLSLSDNNLHENIVQ